MNKGELVDKIAEANSLTKTAAAEVVETVFDQITTALKHGDKVQITGFGSFEVTHRASRVARNPRTGEEIKVAASKAPKFKAGKALKDAVNH